MPFLQILSLIKTLPVEHSLKACVEAIQAQITQGQTITTSLKHSGYIPYSDICLIAAGEETGRLAQTLRELTHWHQDTVQMQTKFRQSLSYPTAILAISIIMAGMMILLMVPELIVFYQLLDIPASTSLRLLQFIYERGWILGCAFCIIMSLSWVARPIFFGSYFYQKVKKIFLQAPVIQSHYLQFCDLQFVSVLCLSYQSGLPIRSSLQLLKQLPHPKHKNICLASAAIESGHCLYTAFMNHKLLTRAALAQIAVSEESGHLEKTLCELKKSMQFELALKIEAAPKKLEPWLMLIVGSLVGGLLYTLYAPLLSAVATF